MPVVDHIPIHTTVRKFLYYIVNGDKTEQGLLVTGINISTNIDEAYDAFKYTYVYFSKDHIYDKQKANYTRNEKGQLVEHGKVVMHHYYQSFDPKDKITPEEANAIGVEWAKKTFGDDFQVIVSTHVDKNHIHNHFAVCPFSLSGKHWIDNEKSLNYCRKMSDKITLEHGFSTIENPRHKNTMKYNEWEARQNGTSWKKTLCDKLDALILKDDVTTLEDIQKELQKEGYYVRLGKYMTIKPPDQKRSIRTENLDRIYGGYSMRELEYRLKHKNKEISISAISQMSGLQKYYAIYMRSLQITVFKTNGKKDKNKTYRELVRTADLLTYTTLNHLYSQDEFNALCQKKEAEYSELKKTQRSLERKIKKLENESNDSNSNIEELKKELELINENTAKAELEMGEARKFYQQYVDEYCTDDYTRALEEYRQLNQMLEAYDKNSEKELSTDESEKQYDAYSL